MVRFFSEDTDFRFSNAQQTRRWLKKISSKESVVLGNINYIFCSDLFLLQVNQDYLNHDYFTDIISFDLSETEAKLDADIYISIERVKDNAQGHSLLFKDELDRVMIHGILHLIGYNDHSEEERTIMRKKETACLSLRQN